MKGLEQTLEEHSPEHGPQSNGSAEAGVKFLKGRARTLRSCLESLLAYRVSVQHPLMAWMIRHAASLVTWCAKGRDGQSAHQRARSRQFVKHVSDGRRWYSGVGFNCRICECMVISGDEIKLARTVVGLPEVDKCDKQSLTSVRATPWDAHRPREPEIVLRTRPKSRNMSLRTR